MATTPPSDEPTDRLTRMCDRMQQALEADPEYTDEVKAIVMLDDGSNGGISMFGYEDAPRAFTDLLTHVKALFEANGYSFEPIPVDKPMGHG